MIIRTKDIQSLTRADVGIANDLLASWRWLLQTRQVFIGEKTSKIEKTISAELRRELVKKQKELRRPGDHVARGSSWRIELFGHAYLTPDGQHYLVPIQNPSVYWVLFPAPRMEVCADWREAKKQIEALNPESTFAWGVSVFVVRQRPSCMQWALPIRQQWVGVTLPFTTDMPELRETTDAMRIQAVARQVMQTTPMITDTLHEVLAGLNQVGLQLDRDRGQRQQEQQQRQTR